MNSPAPYARRPCGSRRWSSGWSPSPLVTPFAAAHGTVTVRTAVLVHVIGPDGEGWGECGALPEPTYTAEFTDGALVVLRDHLVPRLIAAAAHRSQGIDGADLPAALDGVVGHPMAKAALELALLDAEGRASGTPLARTLSPHPPGPAAEVPAGVAVGLLGSPDAVAAEVEARVAEGYRRVKLKIAPGRDIEHLPRRTGGGRGLTRPRRRRQRGLPARRRTDRAGRRPPLGAARRPRRLVRRARRDLPWRRTRDPYAILVSEVMLQRTQVSRVVPRYVAWLERWPAVTRSPRPLVPR